MQPAPVSGVKQKCRPGNARLIFWTILVMNFLVLEMLVPGRGAGAADWYVDASAPSSQARTWRSFARIDWSRLRPGDTLHIVGDGCGPAYRETLVVGASGSSSAPLVIAGKPRSARGGPVIDGGNRRRSGVVLQGRAHVTLRGLTIRNHAGAAISVHDSRAGILVEANNLFSGDPRGGNARGIDARRNRGNRVLVVRGNRFATPARTRAQTDGIYSMDNDGAIYEGNRIVISNNDTAGHSDGFQSYRDKKITVRGNWFEQANNAPTDNHGVWISNSRAGGRLIVQNNFVLAPNLREDSAVTYYRTSDWKETAVVRIGNNTILGGLHALNLANAPQARAYGNVLAPVAGGLAVRVLDTFPPAGSIDRNLLWMARPGDAVGRAGPRVLSWSEWRRRGYDTHGARLASRPAASMRGVQAALSNLRGRYGTVLPLRLLSDPDPPLTACPAAR